MQRRAGSRPILSTKLGKSDYDDDDMYQTKPNLVETFDDDIRPKVSIFVMVLLSLMPSLMRILTTQEDFKISALHQVW